MKLSKDKSLSRLAHRAVEILLDHLDKRFVLNDDMILASFLDPSMQHLPIILQHFERHETDVAELLHQKWVKYDLTIDKPASSEDVNRACVEKKKEKELVVSDPKRIRLELIAKHCSMETVVGHSPVQCLRREINKYTSIIGVVEEPLIWWRKNAAQFPYLSQLTRVILSFPATSAIVERFFSKAGILVTKRKANLNPTTMVKILFIHENFQLIKDFYDKLL